MRRALLVVFTASLALAEPPDGGCPVDAPAPQWVERTYASSHMPGPDGLETWSLRLDGGAATLAFERRELRKHETEWRCVETSTQTGTRRKKGDGFVLTFDELTLRCTPTTLRVAPVGARRVALPPIEEDCHRHRWATARKVEVPALVCKSPLAPGDDPVFQKVFTFAAPPGLERLVVEADDCGLAFIFNALRRTPPDGGVLPATLK